ncbi:CAIB/BAIF family CoA transferase [Oceanicola sp. 22II-s10i]|uniref:CoA transferase n=1 Tax=Oceanicola sp. 22II-s10i TaxID=1317116 RepID=UPI000B528F52|nr:CoA transferase [Oceanicola sp. 22II-s10i]OWU86200.1 CAIB/BAIF family CoA transferase [Oceanicola sp. 22II-s10i]
MQDIRDALGLSGTPATITGEGNLPSRYAVTDVLAASVGAVGEALAQLMAGTGLSASVPAVSVDRRLASFWSWYSLAPDGWELPPVWDAVAGIYRTRDGWIRLHTNLPHHRDAALGVLDAPVDRDAVAAKVAEWDKDPLETAIVEAGGVAAAMRSRAEWRAHPNGAAVAAEPLIHWDKPHPAPKLNWEGRADRPLAGLRVLDLTRVLAGPVSTRTLAGFGAEVLRIDPPGWDEANVVPDITLGKRCAKLDLKDKDDRSRFETLVQGADVIVHGYRPEALAGLGYSPAALQILKPGLIEVTLDAYGWTGPWNTRRGFDSLVQMACGIADAGMGWAGADQPTPLPVQALDHATGYLMAAAALRLIHQAAAGEGAGRARLSLARTGELVCSHRQEVPGTLALKPSDADYAEAVEQSPWGPSRRLRPSLTVAGAPMHWDRSAQVLGSSPPEWLS